MGSLAVTVGELGDFSRARTLYEEIFNVRVHVLAAEHPSTLLAMHGLAGTLFDQGDLEGARALQDRVLDAQTHVLGLEHPDTLGTMRNLMSDVQREP
jgi:hypothetical protein